MTNTGHEIDIDSLPGKILKQVYFANHSFPSDGPILIKTFKANDVVTFVKNDLKVFGVSIMLFLIVTLTII